MIQHCIWSNSVCVLSPWRLILDSRIWYQLIPLKWELSFYIDNINILLSQRCSWQYQTIPFYLIDHWLMTSKYWHEFILSLKILTFHPYRHLSESAFENSPLKFKISNLNVEAYVCNPCPLEAESSTGYI